MSESASIAAPDAAPVVPSTPEAAAPEASAPASAPENDNQPEQSGESDEKAEQKPRQKASERIGELYGRMKAMERERNQALQELERLRQPVVDPAKWDQMSYDEQQAAQPTPRAIAVRSSCRALKLHGRSSRTSTLF